MAHKFTLFILLIFFFNKTYAQFEENSFELKPSFEFVGSYQKLSNSLLDDRYKRFSKYFIDNNIDFPKDLEQKAAFLFGIKIMLVEDFWGHSGLFFGFGRKKMNASYKDIYGYMKYDYKVSTFFAEGVHEYNFYNSGNNYFFAGFGLGSTYNLAEINEEIKIYDSDSYSFQNSINENAFSFCISGYAGMKIETPEKIYSFSGGYRFAPVYNWKRTNDYSDTYYDFKGIFVMLTFGWKLYSN